MKRIVMAALLGFSLTVSFAQTTEEWLHQKKTRLKYLAQQVAALEVYLVDMKKGYRTVQSGLGLIDNLKRGDFSLHQGYIQSLSYIDPAVGRSATAQGIFMIAKNIAGTITGMHALQSSLFLQPAEKKYIRSVTGNLLQKSAEGIDNLTLFIQSGETAMTEEDRMQHIESLYKASKDRYAFLLHFRQDIKLLVTSRTKEKKNNQDMNVLYGIK